jgi:hypothetical protein
MILQKPVIATTFSTGYTNDNKPTFSGTTGKNTTIAMYTVTINNTYTTLAGSVTVVDRQDNATWTFTPTNEFTDGTHTIVAKASNQDLSSDYSDPITFIVDTVAPNKPVIVSTIKTDVISGTAEANSTVLIKKDDVQVATAAVNSAGIWKLKVASIDSYAPAKYSYVDRDTALNVSDATAFDTSKFSIRYSPISITAKKSKTVMPVISGRLSGDTSTVFTVASKSKLSGTASIDPATGRLTVKSTKKGSATIIVRAYSPIYGTKSAPVTIRAK